MTNIAYLQLLSAAAAAGASLCAALTLFRRHTSNSEERSLDGAATWRRLMSPLAAPFRPETQEERNQLEGVLLASGRREGDLIERFVEERTAALLVGLLTSLTMTFVIGGTIGLILSLIAIYVGITGPRKKVEGQTDARRDQVSRSLSGAVDLLTTCIDAGLSVQHAIIRVARELEYTAPLLAGELNICAREFEAGVSLPEAMRRLARRIDLDELAALCGVIAQSHDLGAPIGKTLRDYAEASRKQRMSMLEERAGTLAAQLTLPTSMCLLPAALAIIIGPAVVQLMQAFK